MESINIHGSRVAFERRGDGPALVLLHGGLSDHREWRRQLDTLSEGFTVVAWDAPGCGGSTDPPETFRLPQYADSLAGFIEALGLERPHVIGLSWGSSLALELYRRWPGMPRSLTLASAYAGWAGSLPPREVAQRRERALRDLDDPTDQLIRGWLPTLLTERAPQDVVAELSGIMSDFHPAGARAMVQSMAVADLRDVLPTIDIPTLLLHGEEDRRSPLSVAEEMHRQIPGSALVLLPGAGHQSNMEVPDLFNGAVRTYLRSH